MSLFAAITGMNPNALIGGDPNPNSPFNSRINTYGIRQLGTLEAEGSNGAYIPSKQRQDIMALDNFSSRVIAKYLADHTSDEVKKHIAMIRNEANGRRKGESLTDYQIRMRSGDYYPTQQQLIQVGNPGVNWTPDYDQQTANTIGRIGKK
jgi:hypothetical protein